MTRQAWNQVAIVGVGLIGGSIGMALLKRKLAKEVVGVGRHTANLKTAKRVGAVSSTTTDLAKGVANAEVIIVCTPVESIVEQVRAIGKILNLSRTESQIPTKGKARRSTERIENPSGDVLITDAGSTKADIVRQLEAAEREPSWPKGVRFIGSHPVAGNEKRGAHHSSADLFEGRTVVITATENSPAGDVRRLKQFWSAIGAKVVAMTAEEHDAVMAGISHLPHLLASAIAAATPDRYVSLSGSGWQDTTRIAAGDPALWRQILLANRANVIASLKTFDQRLAAFRSALEAGDANALERLLAEAKQIRDAVAN